MSQVSQPSSYLHSRTGACSCACPYGPLTHLSWRIGGYQGLRDRHGRQGSQPSLCSPLLHATSLDCSIFWCTLPSGSAFTSCHSTCHACSAVKYSPGFSSHGLAPHSL